MREQLLGDGIYFSKFLKRTNLDKHYQSSPDHMMINWDLFIDLLPVKHHHWTNRKPSVRRPTEVL
jgi:hypothetical protein